jgi:PAS domain S-box-containing protein
LRIGRRKTHARDLGWRDASARIRSHLDTERVIHETVQEVQHALRVARTELWMTRGHDEPRRVSVAGRLGTDEQATPRPVRQAAKRARAVRHPGVHATPIIAPRSGLVGVIQVVDPELDDDQRAFVDEVAREVGFALETANLYEQAVAGKEKSEAILSKVADAIVVTDVGGRILQWNERAEWYFERSATDAIGRSCAEALALSTDAGPLDCTSGCAMLRNGVATSTLGIEVARQRVDGRKQPLLASVSEVTDADGVPYEVVHSLRDITRLREADEAKTMFLATASHELKTPLTVIQGFAQLLADPGRVAPEDRSEALQAIRRRAMQLDGIVERLLLSSRIEAGRAEVDVVPLDIAPIVCEEATSLAGATRREIICEIADELPNASADQRAVLTITQHLLENAVKYSPSGAPIRVQVLPTDTQIMLSVTDQGIGMDAEQAARCFDKFWQGESSDVRRYGGTGIGLYIVRALVLAMEGHVSVQSTPGTGSTFVVALPRADAPAQASDAAADHQAPVSEPSVIREFMRQMGIPTRR